MEQREKEFESRFGCAAPRGLLQFLGSQFVRNSLPAAFQLEGVDWVIEIQYLPNVLKKTGLIPGTTLLPFAATTDGRELVVDLAQESSRVLQVEFGDVDSLDVSLGDLLSASCVPLSQS